MTTPYHRNFPIGRPLLMMSQIPGLSIARKDYITLQFKNVLHLCHGSVRFVTQTDYFHYKFAGAKILLSKLCFSLIYLSQADDFITTVTNFLAN